MTAPTPDCHLSTRSVFVVIFGCSTTHGAASMPPSYRAAGGDKKSTSNRFSRGNRRRVAGAGDLSATATFPDQAPAEPWAVASAARNSTWLREGPPGLRKASAPGHPAAPPVGSLARSADRFTSSWWFAVLI